MKPSIWGPPTWTFLHSITLNYPDNPTSEDKIHMKNFIDSLGNVLPCLKCKYNFKLHLKDHPLTEAVLDSKKNLIMWMIDIHNSVNKLTNKKIYSYDEALLHLLSMNEKQNNIEQFSALSNCMSSTNIFLIVCFIILIILVVAGGCYYGNLFNR